jgi:hypothetical protein
MKIARLIVVLFGLAPSLGSLHAQVPKLVNYQGRVAVNGVNFDGTGQFKFALVNADGSVTYWSNNGTSNGGSEPSAAVPLTVTQGLYSLLLGDTALGANMTNIPSTVFGNPDVRLRVWFNDGVHGSQLLTPDQRLAPATYLADDTVTSASVGAAAITAGKIAPAAVTGANIAPASLDSTIFAVPGPPVNGQVLGYNNGSLTWTAPGGGVFSLNGTNAYYNGGNVGIGTTNPLNKLEVNTVSGAYGFTHTAGTISLGSYAGGSGSGATGGWLGTISDDALHFFVHGGQPRMTISKTGKVGIGTIAPEPTTGLTIQTTPGLAANKWGLEQTDGTVRLSTHVDDNGYNTGIGTRSNHPFSLFVNEGPPSLTISTAGNVGIGTDIPATKLEVRTASNSYGLFHSDGTVKLATFVGGGAGGGWLGTYSNHPLHLFVNGGQPALTVNTNNTVSVKVLTITGGADIAEPFPMKEEKLEKGSVVVIDAEHPGRLKRSTKAYDRCVAGIVSGANGINPGIALHQEGMMEGGENVALSGRVYVEADASASSIEPGDMLTTSDTPGYAMKVTEPKRAQGAVIGKAMSGLEEGTGMVLVLVTLQ